MFNTPDSTIVFFFVIFVAVVALLYNYVAMIQYKKKKEEEKKRSEVLYRSSNTDNGVPADEVFQTLKDAGIEPNYLGTKGETLQ